MKSRKLNIITGVIFASLEKISTQGIKIVVSILLARLLSPDLFGIFGITSIFLAISQVILDSGFNSALIQKKDVNQTDLSSTFFLEIVLGFLIMTILFFLSEVIANYFDEPVLLPVIRVLSTVVFINGFGLVQSAIFTRELDFRSHLLIQIAAGFLSGIVAIFLACFGYGIWSLVVQTILASFISVVLLWINSPWRPTFQLSFSSIKSLFSFGSSIFASGFLDAIFGNIYQAFIGKVYTNKDLGFYSNSKSFVNSLLAVTGGSLSRVLFPAMSSQQDENERLGANNSQVFRLSCFIHFPMMIALFVLAEPLILFLLTEKWAGSIPIFQLLILAGIFYPLNVLNLNVLKVKGRSDLFLQLEVIKKIFTVIVVLFTYKKGVIALLMGNAVTSMISYFINVRFTGRLINYGLLRQIKDVFTSMIASIIMGAAMYFFLSKTDFGQIALLLSASLVGLLVYFGVNLIIPNSAIKEFRSIINSLLLQIKSEQ